MHINYFTKSVFSVANMYGLAAALLSMQIGSQLGAFAFLITIFIGTFLKYEGLRGSDFVNPSKNALAFLFGPSFTAKCLMIAAFINGFDASLGYFFDGPAFQNENLYKALGWYAGVIGDNALRYMDDINYSSYSIRPPSHHKSSFKRIFKALFANPVLFYNVTAIFFTLVLFEKQDEFGLETVIGWFVMTISGFGIIYSFFKALMAFSNAQNIVHIQDGALNISSVIANAGLGILAVFTQQWWMVAGQIIFAISAIKALFETQKALIRDGVTQ